jgi:hypothetical protein
LCLLSRCRFIFHSSDIQVTRFVKYFVLQGWSVRNRLSLVIFVHTPSRLYESAVKVVVKIWAACRFWTSEL